jgi:ribosomal protein L29
MAAWRARMNAVVAALRVYEQRRKKLARVKAALARLRHEMAVGGKYHAEVNLDSRTLADARKRKPCRAT